MSCNKQFCVFIDILGFKNKMNNFEDALKYYKQFFAMYEAFDKSHDSMLSSVSDVLQSDSPEIEKSKVSVGNIVFSDSILLYSADWKALLFRVSNVMSWLLSLGFFFRGGVGYGKHYSDIQLGQVHIVSEGLVQAVEIESKKSNYPRIVISQQALDEILVQMSSLYDLNNMLIQSEDNMWFINPFFLNPDISPICECVEKNIAKYSSEGFVEKYVWMQELCKYFYHQELVRVYPSQYFSDESQKYHFFYPKTFHVQVFGGINYSLKDTVYRQSFQTNIEQIIQQQKPEFREVKTKI